VARTGAADEADLETSIGSVLKINAVDAPDVYGGLKNLTTGFKVLQRQLGAQDVDTELARYAAALVFLERRFRDRQDARDTVRAGVERAAAQAAHFGLSHENLLANLADIYQQTISQLGPRIMVMGEPEYLSNTANANKIRALLLAGLRSVWLWRQCGGNRFKFLLDRGRMRQEAQRLLQSL